MFLMTAFLLIFLTLFIGNRLFKAGLTRRAHGEMIREFGGDWE